MGKIFVSRSPSRYKKEYFFNKIDKRYFSLLSVLLERNGLQPKLNNLVSFITWNYDLQVEMTYSSFLSTKNNSLDTINTGFHFMNDINEPDIIHLNGYRGVFKHSGQVYPIVEDNTHNNLEEYLLGLLENYSQFKRPNPDYSECIKYAWKSDSKSIDSARKIMKDTDILIVIGYSFPSFNRRIDSELIKEFESTSYHKIVYQDPFANEDIVNSIFSNPSDVILEKANTKQFYIPHEFLFPSEGSKIVF